MSCYTRCPKTKPPDLSNPRAPTGVRNRARTKLRGRLQKTVPIRYTKKVTQATKVMVDTCR